MKVRFMLGGGSSVKVEENLEGSISKMSGPILRLRDYPRTGLRGPGPGGTVGNEAWLDETVPMGLFQTSRSHLCLRMLYLVIETALPLMEGAPFLKSSPLRKHFKRAVHV